MPIHKILIVDDSRTEQLHLTRLLHRNGYVVRTADGAEQALRQLADERPDLILMDVVMPGQNGFQLTRSIHRSLDYVDIPIIMCTSKNLESDRVWALRQGAADYVSKPVDPDELIGKIRALG